MNALEIYEQARRIDDAESRRRYVAEACGGDAALRCRVESMLGIGSVPESFLGSPVVVPATGQGEDGAGVVAREAAVEDPLLGAVIGGVALERLVGQGGMGRVYCGTQASTGGRVAVKVLMPHAVSEGMLKRFALEARLLARLRHPGIAQIYSAGTVASSGVTLPYFVMEYIAEARPITDYAEANRLDTPRRLELFRKACEAVAYGHEHGVIHRDLKPANILVDRFGQPKVIDFGVAKCTDADLTMTTVTADGGIVGTLKYMSPEQVAGDQDAITVRSDVHALGVVLYELLTRRMPFDFANALPIGVAQVIKTHDPKPLSSVSRAFRGDLDAITAKCLEKDRHDRYASAADLGAEIGRYLAGEPILTRPVGFVGGLVRLFRKHKAAAAAVAGVAASLVAAVVGISVFAVRAERAQHEEARQRATAEAESATARRRLYHATLSQFGAALERPGRGLAKSLLREAEAAFRDAHGATAAATVELNALRSDVDASLVVMAGHEQAVMAVALSPDGTRLATASADGTARIWDVAAGTSLCVLADHAKAVTSIAFSPDGASVATGSEDATARIWDVATGKPSRLMTGHDKTITSLAFSPDGSRLVTGSVDTTVRMWDSSTGESLHVLTGHEAGISALAFSPDGTRLATGDAFGTTRVWDASTGESLRVLSGREAGISALAFSPDGTRLATGSHGGVGRIWSLATGDPQAVLEEHRDGISSLAFSPDGARLATGSSDGSARIWDAFTGESKLLLAGHEAAVHGLAFSPDGTRLATGSGDATARMWDVATGASLDILKGHEAGIRSLAFSSDGTRLATGSGDGTARIWDATTEGSLGVLDGQEDGIRALAFAPDGTRLATTSGDGSARIWDVATSRLLARFVLAGREARVSSLAFSADGTCLETRSDDGTAWMWDLATAESGTALKREPVETGLAPSPDGTRLATTASLPPRWNYPAGEKPDTNVTIRDASTGRVIEVLQGHTAVVACLAWSPDGSRLVTGSDDSTVRIWQVATGGSSTILEGHEAGVTCLALSPDGTRLVTGSDDATVRVWNALTGESLAVLKGHETGISSLAFSPDGARVATGSAKGPARIRGLSNAEIHRNRLSSAERRGRLAAILDDWFTGDRTVVKARLTAAKDTMAPDDWREAANMVLERESMHPGPRGGGP